MDRDGTINEEVGYLRDPEDLTIIPQAFRAIELINENRLKAVGITNQSGVARGYFSEERVEQIHRRLNMLLKEKDVYLDGIYHCPHHPQGKIPEYSIQCMCRKPASGMADIASKELDIDLHRSYVIGDKRSDIELAHNIGAKGILVLTGYGKDEVKRFNEMSMIQPWSIAENILDAVKRILCDLQPKK